MAQSQQSSLPRRVDPLKLTHQEVVLEGCVPIAEMSRICALLKTVDSDICIDDFPPAEVIINFALDENKNRVARGTVKTQLQVLCQRCLSPMQVPLEHSFAWGFTWDDEKAKALPRELDPVLVDPDESSISVYEAVEDELLLALPITFFHQECADGDDGSTKQFGEIVEPDEDPNPFQALKDLNINASKTRKS